MIGDRIKALAHHMAQRLRLLVNPQRGQISFYFQTFKEPCDSISMATGAGNLISPTLEEPHWYDV